jgi:L-galactose dehydrogenase/L-glyceraldehyde 3-phosphate reductase
MQYRKLGRTDLMVSEVGFGCGNTAGLMVRGSREDQLGAVRHALRLGINYFDTAQSYGDGKSEANLGTVLKELGANSLVATKVRVGAYALSDLKTHTLDSVEQSLQRLQRNCIDLIQLHTRVVAKREEGRFGITPDEVLGATGVLGAFKVLRDRGKARFFGFSALGDPAATRTLIDAGEFDALQVYYNLLNPSAGCSVPPDFSALNYERIIDHAAAQGMGVVVVRVLAGGASTATPDTGGAKGSAPPSPGSDYELDVKRSRMLGFLIGGEIKTLPQAALRFALTKSEISTVLVGFSSLSQIDEAIACSGAGGLPEGLLSQLGNLWDSDFGTTH